MKMWDKWNNFKPNSQKPSFPLTEKINSLKHWKVESTYQQSTTRNHCKFLLPAMYNYFNNHNICTPTPSKDIHIDNS